VQSPLLTRLSRELAMDFSIVEASVGKLKDTPYGQLTLELPRQDEPRFQQLLAALESHQVRYEVLR